MLKQMIIAASLFAAAAASAQDAGWTYRATLYGWLPSMSGSVDTLRFGKVETTKGTSDVLDALDMAFMGTFSAQHDRWGFVGDLLYTDLSNSAATPGQLFGDGTLRLEMTALSGYALYRVTNDPSVQFDVGAGFRNFDMNLTASLSAGTRPGGAQKISKSWTDPLIAARLVVPMDDNWFINGFADYGGTGNGDETYQVYAGVGYNFAKDWSAQFGYRLMNISQQVKGRDVSLDLSGALIGVSYNF